MSPNTLIVVFILFFALVQVRNIFKYRLYDFKQQKDAKFYVNSAAVIVTFIICGWALNKFVLH
jgi:hypothetical protein